METKKNVHHAATNCLLANFIKNRWPKEKSPQIQPKALPEGVTDRTVKYKFLQLDNPKSIMRHMHYSYDENKSHNRNCVDFLNKIQSEQRFVELWDKWKIDYEYCQTHKIA